ncbi:hypothetical protein AAHC03_025462 [Spirometra sp. Aus1]
MCSHDSGCLVVVDRGFGTADIIAHELGHQLGAKHDFEIGSECGISEGSQSSDVTQPLGNRLHSLHIDDSSGKPSSRNTLMSGILNFELYPFRWSACSRASIKNFLSPRYGGDYCLGTDIQVRSCNLEACATSTDTRQQLCNKVGAEVGLELRAYNPKFGESSACKLVCLNGSKALQHKMNLPDGTPCFPPRNDICIQGKCWTTGCDRVLGSRMQTDNCNVCGGDNSTCEEVTGVFRGSQVLPRGTKPVGKCSRPLANEIDPLRS